MNTGIVPISFTKTMRTQDVDARIQSKSNKATAAVWVSLCSRELLSLSLSRRKYLVNGDGGRGPMHIMLFTHYVWRNLVLPRPHQSDGAIYKRYKAIFYREMCDGTLFSNLINTGYGIYTTPHNARTVMLKPYKHRKELEQARLIRQLRPMLRNKNKNKHHADAL